MFILISVFSLQSQDLIFSQFYNAPLHNNSAFAGTVTYPKFAASYRLQWPGIAKTYESYGLTYDQYFKSKNVGLGAVIVNDDQGDGTIRTNKFKGVFSYNLRFNVDWQLKFGVGAGYVQHQLDWDKLVFFDQLDIEFGPLDRNGNKNPTAEIRPSELSNGYFDMDMGILLYNPTYYVGASLFHLNGPSDGFISTPTDPSSGTLPILLSIQAGYQIVISRDNKRNPTTFISPNLLYATQSGFHQINVGAYLQKDAVFGGLWLRHTIENVDAWIVAAGVYFDNFKVAYSFDITSSALGLRNSGGSHEIGISMGLRQFEKKESRYNDCFSLFR